MSFKTNDQEINGFKFYWDKEYYDENYTLKLISKNAANVKCGNPWNLFNKETSKLIKETKPKRDILPGNNNDNNASIITSFLSEEEIKNKFYEFIGADC